MFEIRFTIRVMSILKTTPYNLKRVTLEIIHKLLQLFEVMYRQTTCTYQNKLITAVTTTIALSFNP